MRRRYRTEIARDDVRPGLDLTYAFWPELFEALDAGTMRIGAEARYPFLDLRLVRYVARLPGIPWGPEKSLMRVALRGMLPRDILRRPKAPVTGNP